MVITFNKELENLKVFIPSLDIPRELNTFWRRLFSSISFTSSVESSSPLSPRWLTNWPTLHGLSANNNAKPTPRIERKRKKQEELLKEKKPLLELEREKKTNELTNF
jgi:hypothetical protein